MAVTRTYLSIGTIVILSLLDISYILGASISGPISNDLYTDTPTEVYQLKPLLIYPQSKDLKFFKQRTSDDKHGQDKVIYVQLLKTNYRPKNLQSLDDFDINSSYPGPKDIFYVKALANGQFSDHRLMVYRTPEFYAINVYKKAT